MNIEIKDGVYKGYVTKVVESTLGEIFGPYKVMSEAMVIIYAFIVPFFIKVVFDIARLFSKNMQIQKQKLDIEIENINIEKDFLKAQLNPHFLFNTLNNLYGLTVGKNDNASEVILNLSDVMAYTLYESNTEKVQLQKELEFIQNYFSLEKMRYPENKDIRLEIVGEENIRTLYIAPLLTFTFMENAFKYGLKSVDNSFLHIFIQVSDDIFSFELKNDINNHKITEQQTNIGGIGIENVKKRLLLLYPGRHALRIEKKEDEFRVSLQIKLK
ncbi:sensor histidine kinase [Elizabethkingia sp. JS20170427COW]|uniref:sensor histidine kinase n=1 Tax=Elizabethkingia sp. JS20170427COW TaxID=2583851 RepID=UPI002105BCB9|nr:sensor histidine kinase [Elizabethkingia sp. JS20170427COW]